MATVVMYTTQQCPYCLRAKALLKHKQIPFQEIDVTADAALREKMVEESGQRTVPQIFIDGKPIGGFDELRAMEAEGALDRLLGA